MRHKRRLRGEEELLTVQITSTAKGPTDIHTLMCRLKIANDFSPAQQPAVWIQAQLPTQPLR